MDENEINDRMRIDWSGLQTYTSHFKEWVLKLFRKSNMRMGHIEEELAKLKRKQNTSYSMVESLDGQGNLIYSLIENGTGENHGNVVVNMNGSTTITTWHEDGDK